MSSLNSEPSSELDKQQQRNSQTEQVKMAATEAGSPRRLGLNLNLSVQPHAAAYHWPHSTVAEDTSPSRSKGCTDDDDDDDDEDDRDMDDRDMDDDDIMMDCRQDEDCSPEDEQEILEMQREERETLNQLARQLASGSRLITPMLQHLVYQHPGLSVQPSPMHQQQLQQQPSSVAVSLTTAALNRHATAAAADLSPKSSHSGDVPMSGGRSTEVQSPSAARNNEAQSWTFEEQFRQVSDVVKHNYRTYHRFTFIAITLTIHYIIVLRFKAPTYNFRNILTV
ncbi:protein dead ringer [Aphis craccivora]|uniref:Protein dead ringer n=1 Tax=Aphis craccivora TaxID=307492 RepID=A0A6G0ZNJ1_APHCR|nr:protein dead ringer [Aphis craccivora]